MYIYVDNIGNNKDVCQEENEKLCYIHTKEYQTGFKKNEICFNEKHKFLNSVLIT